MKSRKCVLLFAVLLFGLNVGVGVARAESTYEIRSVMEKALGTPPVYRGFYAKEFDQGKGTFCEKEAVVSLGWQGQVGDSSVTFDDNLNAKIHVEFDDSVLHFKGYRKGGVLCTWMGGGGQMHMGKLTSDVALVTSAVSQFPKFLLNDLKIAQIKFDHFEVGMLHFQGGAPQWLNNYAEKNINLLIARFMASELKTRFEAFISDELAKKLGQINEDDSRSLNKTHSLPRFY